MKIVNVFIVFVMHEETKTILIILNTTTKLKTNICYLLSCKKLGVKIWNNF
jgi:hypothetical protein